MVHEARVPVARIDRCMFRLDATVAVTMRAMASFSRWRNERCPGLQKYGPPHVSYEAKCQFVITALLGVQAPPPTLHHAMVAMVAMPSFCFTYMAMAKKTSVCFGPVRDHRRDVAGFENMCLFTWKRDQKTSG